MPKSRKGNRAWRMLPVALCISTMLVLGLPGVALASPGDLDLSFNTDGWATTLVGPNPPSGQAAAAQSVAIQADGGIVLAGQVGPGNANSFGLARYEPVNGTLDPSFDGDGKVLTFFGQFSGARGVAIQPADQKIVAVGYRVNGSTTRIALARYMPDGSLDPTFDVDGKVTTSIGVGAEAFAVAIQSNGLIVVAGMAQIGSQPRFVVARYLDNGSLDTAGFGANNTPPGTVTTAIGPDSQALSVAIQPIDQYIVVAGSTSNVSTSKFALARYTTNGSLDTTGFGANSTPPGTVTTAFGSPSVADATSVAIQGTEIVAAGSRSNGTNIRFAAANYLSDGSLDTSFGPPQTGKVTTALGSFSSATAVALQPVDGKIVLAGIGALAGVPVFALTRYDPITGVRDQSFATNGKVRTPIGPMDAYGSSLAIEPSNGQLVVGGQAFTGGHYRFAVARFDDV